MKIRTVSLIVMIAVLGIGSGVYAKPCTMTLEKAPTLFGFKLGMTQAAAEKRAGEKAEENGLILKTAEGYRRYPSGDKYFIIFNKDGIVSKLVDKTVTSMPLTFMDEKLFKMKLNLNSQSPWVKAPDRLAFFQKEFGIPADAWVEDREGRIYWDFAKRVTCSGVTIVAIGSESSMEFEIFETAVQERLDKVHEDLRQKYHNK